VRNILYSSILQGVNQIAVLRRWESVVSLASLAAAALALLFNGGLLGAVTAAQAGSLGAVLINRRLSMACTPASAWIQRIDTSKQLPREIWSSAWRSGVGVVMTLGVTQGSGILYAQMASPTQVASFLLAQRVMQIISALSMVPFYTKIPELARLYVDRKRKEIVALSRRGMAFTNWMFAASVFSAWLALPPLLRYIGSPTTFPQDGIWWSMATALALHRVGAMYIQTYSVTNHIVWHVADGVSSLIIVAASVPLYATFGVIGLPLAWIAGYLLFYVPYSTYLSVSAFPPAKLMSELLSNAFPVVVVASILLYVL
jgi:O-antigen/teichoic acid export membrane protein